MIYLSLLAHIIATKEKIKNKTKNTIGKVCDYFRQELLRNIIKSAHALGKRNCSLELTFLSFGL